MTSKESAYQVSKNVDSFGYSGSFIAMAGQCTILIDTASEQTATAITKIAYQEASRIEKKYSRYSKDNIIYQFHQHDTVLVDIETAKMLDYAAKAYEMSNGLFDITSGILRKLWKFDGKTNAPSRKKVKELLSFIGWEKANWDGQYFQLPQGMEVDFGGFGKEYAVDKTLELINSKYDCPVMVNFGGDLATNKKPVSSEYWSVGIQSNMQTNQPLIKLEQGAVATSGNANRYVWHKGNKLFHILNPKTGWAIANAPSSITVVMANCLQAGFLSTCAILQGKYARTFLETQEVDFHIQD